MAKQALMIVGSLSLAYMVATLCHTCPGQWMHICGAVLYALVLGVFLSSPPAPTREPAREPAKQAK